MMFFSRVVVCGGLLLLTNYAAGDDFPKPYNSPSEAQLLPLDAQQAARTMSVPTGFRVSVFASEPDVQNPIDMAWDAKGRLWIAENYTYAERSMRFELGLRDRVIVLEDTTGDGKADRRTVFTDAVQMLTSVEVGLGGVWLMCPPQLLFIPDHNHDLVPDGPAEVALDGFDVAKDNYHNFANGLRFGPDGWLYGRCGGSCPGRIGIPGTAAEDRIALEGGIWRYHPITKVVEVLTHGTTNPWGHDWDAKGECFFVNTVNGHLWHMIPGAHFVRPFTLDPNPLTYEMIDMHADHWHFDTKGSWTASRNGAANEFGGGHAHCGTMIYLGGDWPEAYHGQLFTFNIHGQRANQEDLVRSGSGFVAKHMPDTMISKDPFFRGMELMYGPTGSVFLIDWSDTGECHEHTGVHRTSGRVFEVAYAGNEVTKSHVLPVDLYATSTKELLGYLTHENEWFFRQARIVIQERAAAGEDLLGYRDPLTSSAQGRDPVLAYRSLMVLRAMGLVDDRLLESLLSHADESLRVWAIRLLSDHWLIDDCFGPTKAAEKLHAINLHQDSHAKSLAKWLPKLSEMASSDSSGLVRLALASTLQRLPLEHRLPLAKVLASRVEDKDDHNLPLMVWYGIMSVHDTQGLELAKFAVNCQWPKTSMLAARRVAELIEKHPEATEYLLNEIGSIQSASQQQWLLAGFADGLKGWSKAPKPECWDNLMAELKARGDESTQRVAMELSVLFGDGRAVEQLRAIVLDGNAEIGLRRSALEALVENKADGLREICTKVLGDARLNVSAAKGLSLFDDVEVGRALVSNYHRFRSPERPKVVAMMVTRPTFAACLLEAVEQGKLSPSDLSSFDIRQILSLEDEALNQRVSQLWGNVRPSSEDKVRRIAALKSDIQSANLTEADLSAGRALFTKTCMQCHRMYGAGESVGPDLTGSNRNNLDYLLENMVDPSAVVGKDFRMTVLLLDDGRVINGLVISENDRTLTMQTQTERMVIDISSIERRTLTDQSPMPDGLLDNLDQMSIRNLIAYLMHPSQVPLPSEVND